MKRIMWALFFLLWPGWAYAERSGSANILVNALTSGHTSDFHMKDIFGYPLTDQSINFLGQLFGHIPTLDAFSGATGGQLLAQIFMVFNAGIMVIAGAWLCYSIVMIALSSSQQGQMMAGRANEVKAGTALRVAGGIALLVPKFNGYSAIQIIVMWIVVQGVGLADNTWNAAVDYLRHGGQIYVAPTAEDHNDGMCSMIKTVGVSSEFSSWTKPYPNCSATVRGEALSMTSQLFSSLVCMYEHQKLQEKSAQGSERRAVFPLAPQWGAPNSDYAVYFPINLDPQNEDKVGLCGRYQIRPSLPKIYAAYVRAAIQESIYAMESSADYLVNASGVDWKPSCGAVHRSSAANPDDSICRIMKVNATDHPREFEDQLAQMPNVKIVVDGILSGATRYSMYTRPAQVMDQADKNAAHSSHKEKFYQDAKASGWLMLARYYREMIKHNKQAKVGLLSDNFLYTLVARTDPKHRNKTFKPNSEQQKRYNHLMDLIHDYSVVASQMGVVIHNAAVQTAQPSNAESLINMINTYYAGSKREGKDVNPSAGNWDVPILSTILYAVAKASGNVNNDVSDMLRNAYQAWIRNTLGTLSSHPHAGVPRDPISRLSAIGATMMSESIKFWQNAAQDAYHALLNSVWVASGINLGLSILAGFAFGNEVYPVAAGLRATQQFVSLAMQVVVANLFWYLPIGIATSTPLFVMGATLGVYVPLVPYILFLFGAIGWFIAVIEAVVAAPIIALGITHPEGHDLLGKSEQALMLLLGVFLRPVCMLLGFLSALTLMYIVLRLFDAGFFSIFKEMIVRWGSQFSGSYRNTEVFVAIAAAMIIYVLIVAALVDECCSLIYKLPNYILRWLGLAPEQGDKAALDQIKSGLTAPLQAAQGGGAMVSQQQQSGLSQPAGQFYWTSQQSKGQSGSADAEDSGSSSDN